jgi:hypothetical protein
MGQRWGDKSKIIWFIALARSAIVLILFTGISYGVNKDIDLKNDDPVWELSKVKVRIIYSLRTFQQEVAHHRAVKWYQCFKNASERTVLKSVPTRCRTLHSRCDRASRYCESVRP